MKVLCKKAKFFQKSIFETFSFNEPETDAKWLYSKARGARATGAYVGT